MQWKDDICLVGHVCALKTCETESRGDFPIVFPSVLTVHGTANILLRFSWVSSQFLLPSPLPVWIYEFPSFFPSLNWVQNCFVDISSLSYVDDILLWRLVMLRAEVKTRLLCHRNKIVQCTRLLCQRNKIVQCTRTNKHHNKTNCIVNSKITLDIICFSYVFNLLTPSLAVKRMKAFIDIYVYYFLSAYSLSRHHTEVATKIIS